MVGQAIQSSANTCPGLGIRMRVTAGGVCALATPPDLCDYQLPVKPRLTFIIIIIVSIIFHDVVCYGNYRILYCQMDINLKTTYLIQTLKISEKL